MEATTRTEGVGFGPGPEGGPARRRGLVGLAAAAAMGALLLLLYRGFWRQHLLSLDLTMIYAGARAWGQGVDAYTFGPLFDLFQAAGGTGKERDPDQFVSLYPPTTYGLLSPLGVLRWPVAKGVWLGVNAGLVAVAAGVLWRQRPRTGGVPVAAGGLLLLAAWLAWAPLHTGLSMGQLALVVTVLLLPAALPRLGSAGAVLSIRHPGVIGAGVALGLAGMVKPQLAVYVGLAVLLTRMRWAFAWAAVTGAVVTVVALGRLQMATPGWLAQWQQNIATFTGSSIGRPDPSNPQFHEMMHLEILTGMILPSGWEAWTPWLATALPVAVFAAVVVRLGSIGQGMGRGRALDAPAQRALMALAACLTLVTGYHRSYDATLLFFGLVWLAYAWNDRRWWAAGLGTAAAGLFLVPTPSLLVSLTRRGVLPAEWADSSLWQATALQAHAWAVILWSGILVAELWRVQAVGGALCGDGGRDAAELEEAGG